MTVHRNLLSDLVVIVALSGLRSAAQTQPTPPLNFNRAEYQTGLAPYSVAVGDLNGDGKPDLVIPNLNANTVSVMLGKGLGSFQPHQDFATGQYPKGVATGDFNDGKPDLAVANGILDGPGTVSVLLGNGDGTFQPQVQ